MKVFVSSDMEGTTGVVDWSQAVGANPEYEYYRGLLQAEVNAAIDGALAAGATEFLVNDSHSSMQNLRPDELHGQASYLSGKHKPMYMVQGLDASFDAVFFISYHGSMSSSAVLSHTYNPRAIADVTLNGTVVGESGINALVAQSYGVPVVLITGDQTTADEAAPFCPGIEAVVVKQSWTRFASTGLHPVQARELIRVGARTALERLSSFTPPQIPMPATLEVRFHTGDFAEMATWLHRVERIDEKTVAMVDEDPLRLFRTFITAVSLTRSIVEW